MTAPIVERHERLGSTQDRLRELANQGAPVGSRVRAEEQTGGRGRAGKPWASERGAGLWVSVLLPGPAPDRPAGYPLAIGVRLAMAFEARWGGRLAIKWPNDLLDRPGGKKLGGILCETVSVRTESGRRGRQRVMAGIGINVAAAPAGATTLEAWVDASGSCAIAVDEVEDRVLGALARWMQPAAVPPGLDEELHRELIRRDALAGRRVRVDPGPVGSSGLEGIASGIDPSGALLLGVDRDGGVTEERVWSGSVRLQDDASRGLS